MNNRKNGLTFTEVLLVIGLVSFVMLLVFPNLPKTLATVSSRAYAYKKEFILQAAKLYGIDNSYLFNENESIQIKVEDLIMSEYISPDVTSDNDNCDSSYGCIINPDTNQSLNSKYITIIKKGTVYEASMDE